MQGWLIYQQAEAERNKAFIELYQRAFAMRNSSVLLRMAEHLTYGTDKNSLSLSYEGRAACCPDFVIMRAPLPLLSQQLEWMGCRVFNSSRVSRIANDKLQTLQLAASLGLPTTATRPATHQTAEALGAELGYPLVMKPRDGHGGRDVLWITSAVDLTEKLSDYRHTTFLLQQPVADLGRDLRVYVLGGKVAAAMLRSCDTDFRSNYCLGGHAEPYRLSSEICDMVCTLTKALPMDYAGIDFMFSHGRAVLNEIEDVVGARMLYSHTELDIADMHADYILRSLRQL